MGGIYLQLAELRVFGLSEKDILQEKMSRNLHRFMKFQIDRAHHYFEEAHAGISLLEKKSQFAIYSAGKIYRGILLKIEAQNYNPFLGRIFVPQIKKPGILLQEVFKTYLPGSGSQTSPVGSASFNLVFQTGGKLCTTC